LLKSLDEFDLMMLEQPLPYDDIVDHAKLQSKSNADLSSTSRSGRPKTRAKRLNSNPAKSSISKTVASAGTRSQN
jgi:hypothetical protein